MINTSGILGIAGFWGLLLLAMAAVGTLQTFVNLPAAIIVVGVTIGAGLMTFGLKDFFHSLLGLQALVIHVPDDALRQGHAQVLRGLIPSAYAAGVLGTVIGCVQMLATVDDSSVIGAALAVVLLTVLYSVMLAEGILRPGARHIEHRIEVLARAASELKR